MGKTEKEIFLFAKQNNFLFCLKLANGFSDLFKQSLSEVHSRWRTTCLRLLPRLRIALVKAAALSHDDHGSPASASVFLKAAFASANNTTAFKNDDVDTKAFSDLEKLFVSSKEEEEEEEEEEKDLGLLALAPRVRRAKRDFMITLSNTTLKEIVSPFQELKNIEFVEFVRFVTGNKNLKLFGFLSTAKMNSNFINVGINKTKYKTDQEHYKFHKTIEQKTTITNLRLSPSTTSNNTKPILKDDEKDGPTLRLNSGPNGMEELQRLAKIEPKHCTKKTDANDVDLLRSARFKAQTNIVNCEHISLNKLIRILELGWRVCHATLAQRRHQHQLQHQPLHQLHCNRCHHQQLQKEEREAKKSKKKQNQSNSVLQHSNHIQNQFQQPKKIYFLCQRLKNNRPGFFWTICWILTTS